jgi:hypothetical protein
VRVRLDSATATNKNAARFAGGRNQKPAEAGHSEFSFSHSINPLYHIFHPKSQNLLTFFRTQNKGLNIKMDIFRLLTMFWRCHFTWFSQQLLYFQYDTCVDIFCRSLPLLEKGTKMRIVVLSNSHLGKELASLLKISSFFDRPGPALFFLNIIQEALRHEFRRASALVASGRSGKNVWNITAVATR